MMADDQQPDVHFDDHTDDRSDKFSGLNKKQSARAFILSVEAQLSHYDDADKCVHFINCLRGSPQTWYADLRLRNAPEVETWENVKKAFFINYGARAGGAAAFKKCADCKQTATQSADAYYDEFDNASFDVLSLMSEHLRALMFLNNLRPEIVRTIGPQFDERDVEYTVNEVLVAARNAESRLKELASDVASTSTDMSLSTSSSTTSSSDYKQPQKRKLDSPSDAAASKRQSYLDKVQCYKCRNFGHYANLCPMLTMTQLVASVRRSLESTN